MQLTFKRYKMASPDIDCEKFHQVMVEIYADLLKDPGFIYTCIEAYAGMENPKDISSIQEYVHKEVAYQILQRTKDFKLHYFYRLNKCTARINVLTSYLIRIVLTLNLDSSSKYVIPARFHTTKIDSEFTPSITSILDQAGIEYTGYDPKEEERKIGIVMIQLSSSSSSSSV